MKEHLTSIEGLNFLFGEPRDLNQAFAFQVLAEGGRINMQPSAAIKQRLDEEMNMLPENKLEVVLDFVSYLKDRKQAGDFLMMQMGSKAYQDWVSPENGIYDEVFYDSTNTSSVTFQMA